MSWPYTYTPSIWLIVASMLWMSLLSWYGWRNRSIPWAIPFTVLTGTAMLWMLGSGFETTATRMSVKIDWFMFQQAANIPLAVAGLWFALEYAGLSRWAAPRHLALLLFPLVLRIGLSWTNEHHHLLWTRFWMDGIVRGEPGSLGVIFNAYSLMLYLLSMLVMVVLFIRWPLHRWPIGLLLIGQSATRATYLLELTSSIVTPIRLGILSADFAGLVFAFAIFRFHFLSLVPIGREMVIERMTDATLVVNTHQRVADLNPAAEKALGCHRSTLIGQPLTGALAEFPALLQFVTQPATRETAEIHLGDSDASGWYQVSLAPITGATGFRYGQLLVLRDISELKRTQQRLIQEQRTLTALREQERIARELHDELAQELAFINLQAQTVRELLAAGKTGELDVYLGRLSEVVRDIHATVRGMISGLLTTPDPDHSLPEALRVLVQTFTRRYGVPVEFATVDDHPGIHLEPPVKVQLLRIVQEALTNARKHAHADHVHVRLTTGATGITVIVEDNGLGFDATHLSGNGKSFGLRIMRERTADIGGTLDVTSSPEHGTRIVLNLPVSSKEPARDTQDKRHIDENAAGR